MTVDDIVAELGQSVGVLTFLPDRKTYEFEIDDITMPG